MSDIQNNLRSKGMLVFDDVLVKYAGEWKLLRPGNTYIAERESGVPQLLTVEVVQFSTNGLGIESGFVYSRESGASHKLHEVVKVEVVEGRIPKFNKKERDEEVDRSGARGRRAAADRDDERDDKRAAEDRARARTNRRRGGEKRAGSGKRDYTKPAGRSGES